MLFLLFGCQATTPPIDSAIDPEDTLSQAVESCFSEPSPAPFVVYASPYDDDGNQSNQWSLQTIEGEIIDFEMGRSIAGEIHLSTDGSWGGVAQSDGSLGLFRYQGGTVSVIEPAFIPEFEGGAIYASKIWLDSKRGELWITDQNWPDNGGGLFRAHLDCDTGAIISIAKVFSGKNAYSVRPTGEDWVYLSREINGEPHQLAIFDQEGAIIAQGNAFDDDESIFSALASSDTHILVGDNNAFSSIPNRVSHVTWDGTSLSQIHTFDVEDPISMVIVDDWALIASGYGNALWQYRFSTQSINSVLDLPLPSLILHKEDAVYAVANTQIQKLTLSDSGFVALDMVVQREGVRGIIGAAGVFGDF